MTYILAILHADEVLDSHKPTALAICYGFNVFVTYRAGIALARVLIHIARNLGLSTNAGIIAILCDLSPILSCRTIPIL